MSDWPYVGLIALFCTMNKGIVYIVFSGLCFLVVNFFVKILGSGASDGILPVYHAFPPHELVLFRSVISFLITFFLLKYRGLPVLGTNRKWLMIRGLSGMIALTLFFYTIHHLPLAIASTVQYLAPVFTVILAIFLLGEYVSRTRWLFIAIALLGAAVLGLNKFFYESSAAEVSLFWLFVGVISAAFSGLAYTSVIKLKPTDTPLHIVLYFPMLSIPIMGIWSCFEFVWPSGVEWLYLLLLGVFTQLAQVALTKALHLGDASTITPFQYLGSIYALLIGYFVFNEQLAWISYLGIGLILVGVLLNVVVGKSTSRAGK